MRGMCEENGLPRSNFNNHKMVETGEGEGLPRATFNVEMWEENGLSRATFATIKWREYEN